jgi:hypothetical protein
VNQEKPTSIFLYSRKAGTPLIQCGCPVKGLDLKCLIGGFLVSLRKYQLRK